MNRVILILIGFAFFISSSAMADPITVTVSGTTATVTYVEPTKNKDGSTLNDLSKTTIFYNMGAGDVKAIDVPAMVPTGGRTITQNITVPVAADKEANVTIYATATDTSNNVSDASEKKVVRIDKLAPAPPF